VTIAVEGDLDAAVARRVLRAGGLATGPVYGRSGKLQLDKKVHGYNRAAARSCWLVLRDLDHDAGCAPELRQRLLPQPAPWMCFRVVVRAVEAWLLADRSSVARWLQVPYASVPPSPEALDDPKAALVQLARRSQSRWLRDAMIPAAGTRTKVGAGYTGAAIEFVTEHWQPRAASLNSPALAGCLRAIEAWTAGDRA
jgi:hypothetical protein